MQRSYFGVNMVVLQPTHSGQQRGPVETVNPGEVKDYSFTSPLLKLTSTMLVVIKCEITSGQVAMLNSS